MATALLPIVTLLVAGCGDDTSGGSTPGTGTSAPGEPADVDGHTYLSTEVTGRDVIGVIILRFEGGRITASAGCNSMSGTYAIAGGALLLAGGLAQTDMGCEPPLMEQDEWVGALLGASPTVTIDGDRLTIDGTVDGSQVVVTLLDREVADPDRPLQGTTWVVHSIISRDSVSTIPLGTTASLVFANGSVEVHSGCNSGSGSAAVDGETITFGPIGLTKMACPDPAMELERAVLAALGGTATFTIEAGELTILGDGGAGLGLGAEQPPS